MPEREITLLRAAREVLHAPDEASALRVITKGIHEAGWHSVLVHLYDDNWGVTHTDSINIPQEDLDALAKAAMTPAERAATFGPKYEPFRVSRSYFLPAERRHSIVLRTMYLPQPEGREPGDWHPDDAAYVPMRSAAGHVIGRITIDAPYSGRRPDVQTFQMLEAFADLAALGIARLRAQAGQHDAEHAMETVMNSMPAIIWLTDPDSNCTYFNEEWFRFTGSDRNADLTQAISEYCHPDDHAAQEVSFLEAVAARRPFDLEYRLRRYDGEYRWVIEHGRPRFHANGNFAGYVCSALDITAQRQANDDLQRERDRLALAVDASGGGLWEAEYGPDNPFGPGRMQLLSPRIKAFAGYGPDELDNTTKTWDGLVVPEDRAFKDMQDREHVAGRLPQVTREYRIRHKDGSIRWVRSSYLTRRSAENVPSYMVGFMMDITEQKQTEQRLRDLLERERFLVAELDHRVRNALGGLLSLIDLTAANSPDVASCAETLARRVRLMATAHDLMSATHWRPVGLTEMIQRLVPHGAPGQFMHEGPAVEIPARQATAFAMVLHELIANSLKYGALGCDGGSVKVRWHDLANGNAHGQSLRLAWNEHGVSLHDVNPRPGLGTELITGFARSELAGAAMFNYTTEGARHIIEARLDAIPTDPTSETIESTSPTSA